MRKITQSISLTLILLLLLSTNLQAIAQDNNNNTNNNSELTNETNSDEGSDQDETNTDEGSDQDETNTEEESTDEESNQDETNTEEESTDEESDQDETNTDEESTDEESSQDETNTDEESTDEESDQDETNTDEESTDEESDQDETNTDKEKTDPKTEELKEIYLEQYKADFNTINPNNEPTSLPLKKGSLYTELISYNDAQLNKQENYRINKVTLNNGAKTIWYFKDHFKKMFIKNQGNLHRSKINADSFEKITINLNKITKKFLPEITFDNELDPEKKFQAVIDDITFNNSYVYLVANQYYYGNLIQDSQFRLSIKNQIIVSAESTLKPQINLHIKEPKVIKIIQEISRVTTVPVDRIPDLTIKTEFVPNRINFTNVFSDDYRDILYTFKPSYKVHLKLNTLDFDFDFNESSNLISYQSNIIYADTIENQNEESTDEESSQDETSPDQESTNEESSQDETNSDQEPTDEESSQDETNSDEESSQDETNPEQESTDEESSQDETNPEQESTDEESDIQATPYKTIDIQILNSAFVNNSLELLPIPKMSLIYNGQTYSTNTNGTFNLHVNTEEEDLPIIFYSNLISDNFEIINDRKAIQLYENPDQESTDEESSQDETNSDEEATDEESSQDRTNPDQESTDEESSQDETNSEQESTDEESSQDETNSDEESTDEESSQDETNSLR